MQSLAFLGFADEFVLALIGLGEVFPYALGNAGFFGKLRAMGDGFHKIVLGFGFAGHGLNLMRDEVLPYSHGRKKGPHFCEPSSLVSNRQETNYARD
jgi:hypothetical protein